MSHAGKTIVITGASEGIGAKLARRLVADKPNLVLAARKTEPLERIAAECRAKGASVHTAPTDVSTEADCERLIAPALVDRMARAALAKES